MHTFDPSCIDQRELKAKIGDVVATTRELQPSQVPGRFYHLLEACDKARKALFGLFVITSSEQQILTELGTGQNLPDEEEKFLKLMDRRMKETLPLAL